MYYPSNTNNNTNSNLLKRGTTTNGISSNFENIYQPFGNSNNEFNNIEDMNFMNIGAQLGGSENQQLQQQVMTALNFNVVICVYCICCYI